MNHGCPNSQCKVSYQLLFQVKDGHFFRRDDSRYIQRFKCKICGTKYSKATFTLEKNQKKRRINQQVRANLSSGMSMRACAYNLKVARKTIERKLVYLAKKARMNQQKFLELVRENPLEKIQFDDLISSVHTKLKPISVSVVVDPKTFLILGARCAEIPAFGHLAAISRKKYGRRKNLHPKILSELLFDLKEVISPFVEIRTDEHKRYPEIIKKIFPHSTHDFYKGMRASVVGMGELKTKGYDPLFAINHTLACFRYGIDRFIRKTWCTSKKIENAQMHIDIYIDYHNEKKLWKRFKSKKLKKLVIH